MLFFLRYISASYRRCTVKYTSCDEEVFEGMILVEIGKDAGMTRHDVQEALAEEPGVSSQDEDPELDAELDRAFESLELLEGSRVGTPKELPDD